MEKIPRVFIIVFIALFSLFMSLLYDDSNKISKLLIDYFYRIILLYF
jgi:hypothetical protein